MKTMEMVPSSDCVRVKNIDDRISEVLLVDHDLIRGTLLRKFLEHHLLCDVALCTTLCEANEILGANSSVALIASTVVQLGGVAPVKKLISKFEKVKFVLINRVTTRDHLIVAKRLGFSGLLSSNMSPASLTSALSLIFSGEWYSSVDRDEMLQQYSRGGFSNLTGPELEVMSMVSDGLSNKEIAKVLGCAETCVKMHIRHIMAKTGLRNRTQLAVTYLKRHFLALKFENSSCDVCKAS